MITLIEIMSDIGEAPKPSMERGKQPERASPKLQDLASPGLLKSEKGPSAALRSAIGRAQRALGIRPKTVPADAEAGKGRNMYKDLTSEERAARNSGESPPTKMAGNADLESHRFRVSEFSSPKINSLRKEFLAFSYENPSVAGMTIFGSHTKGRAKEGSDIDGYLFVEAPDSPDENNNRVLPPQGDSIYESLNIDVGDKLRNHIGPKLDLTPDQTRDIRLRLLSKKRIDNELTELVEKARQKSGSETDFGKFLRTSPISVNLDKLFHMQLGGGLDQYRSYILRRLQMEGEFGEHAWQSLIATTEMMERDLKLNRNEKLFPQTIAAAIDRFHLENTEPKYQLPSKTAAQ